VKIEVLSIPDCPHRARAVESVRQALRSANTNAEIVEIVVSDSATAAHLRFAGSPTVRINNRDVDEVLFTEVNFGLRCRLYSNPENPGVPSREALLRAIRTALREEAQ